MHVLILTQSVTATSNAADRDVLVQRDAVAAALQGLGHSVTAGTCSLNLDLFRKELELTAPDFVFNLVESVGGTDRLMVLVPILLEAVGIPYSGAGIEAMLSSGSKLATKVRLRQAGLPTPNWLTQDSQESIEPGTVFIVKPVWEHASVGMDDTAVFPARHAEELLQVLQQRTTTTGRQHFAERYIAGREFNLSLLAHPCGGLEVLPPAEIDFSTYPAGKPRIVGEAAKWDEHSFEYQRTPRRFNFPPSDGPLLAELRDLALRCAQAFGISGYARVDFRVDEHGQPWILELNVNPCLSPDAGFVAAAAQLGLNYSEVISRILAVGFA